MRGVRLPITLADGGLLVAYDEEFRLLVIGLRMMLETARAGSSVSINGETVEVDAKQVEYLLHRLQAEGDQSRTYIT